jgi:hypothetical protein
LFYTTRSGTPSRCKVLQLRGCAAYDTSVYNNYVQCITCTVKHLHTTTTTTPYAVPLYVGLILENIIQLIRMCYFFVWTMHYILWFGWKGVNRNPVYRTGIPYQVLTVRGAHFNYSTVPRGKNPTRDNT